MASLPSRAWSARCLLGLLSFVWTAGVSTAQNRSPDADLSQLPVTVRGPNGTHNGRPALLIRSEVVWGDGRFRVTGANGSVCDLVVLDGGVLRLEGAALEVRGDVQLELDGLIRAVDSQLCLLNSYPREFNYWWRGGQLDTVRCSINGYIDPNGGGIVSNLQLHRGLWNATDTVVNFTGGILMSTETGWYGDGMLRGAKLVADGLHAGQYSDFLIMSGHADAVLRNSVYPINFLFHDSAGPGDVTLDLQANSRIGHRVYGDSNVHDDLTRPAVTHDLPGSIWRLELDNVIVPDWSVHVHGVGDGPIRRTFRLVNAERVTLGLHGGTLTGSPTLLGPWRSYYPAPQPLPGLPSMHPPAHHGIPPGCGVRVGNVRFMSPNNQWAYPLQWNLYLDGPGTSYSVVGPSFIGEVYLWRSNLLLEGLGDYDLGVNATTVNIRGDSALTVRNAFVGRCSATVGSEIAAFGRATCDLDRVMIGNILLRTERQYQWGPNQGVDSARITVTNAVDTGGVDPRPSSGGNVDVQRSRATENWDLSNLDFADGVTNAMPAHWLGWNQQGSRSSTTRPGTRDAYSYRYRSSSANASISKQLVFPAGTRIEFRGWLRGLQLPTGTTVECAVQSSTGRSVTVRPTVVAGQWVRFNVPEFVVDAADAYVKVVVRHRGAQNVSFVADDFEVSLPRWWEADNLVNFDLEEPQIRTFPIWPSNRRPPDYWDSFNCSAAIETGDRRPGAAVSSPSLRFSPERQPALIYKSLSFLAPGQVLTISGWVKGLTGPNGPFDMRVTIGEEGNWFDGTYGNNVQQLFRSGSGWQQFQLTYTVPSPPIQQDKTRFSIWGGEAGDVVLVDDIQVTLR